jgi:NAD(P)-dependent dehydrogenase (short-subunit alcohol dehydrogenase family)
MNIPEITLRDKVVLITGAARGAGQVYALACAAAGAEVAAFDIDPLGLTADWVQSETGRQILEIQGDLRRLSDIRSMVDTTVKHFGKLDVLVNNAGVLQPARLAEVSEEDFDRTLGINLKGVFFACKYAALHMIERRSGVIINIGSTLAHVGAAEHGVYCASKGGVRSLTQSLAIELGPYNIRVVTLSPGPIATEMIRSRMENPEFESKMLERTLLGRINEPQDIAQTLVLLASDASSTVTGCSWVIDSGILSK